MASAIVGAKQVQLNDSKELEVGSSSDIWTAAISKSFYKNVNLLYKNINFLPQGRIPCAPKNYRTINIQRSDSDDYSLHYEEELHLADHFAFLAHVEEGVQFVSAVTVEESLNPPSLTVRLASNQTPGPDVCEGLNRIIKIVQDHANEGRRRDEYRSKLLDEVIRFCRKRIYARLRSSHWKMPFFYKAHGEPKPKPLHTQIKKKLVDLLTGREHSRKLSSLIAALLSLVDAMEKVDASSEESQIEILKDMIHKSYQVSIHESSKSLETTLKALGLGITITESREVLEIDKLSKYLQLCNDLIRLSRQPKTRPHFRNIDLEICPCYLESTPLGALETCFVHCEIQLIFFYERYPKQPSPRAIGSSKSACFLCDLFIRHHNKFGISHSHMSLFTKWTVPEVAWITSQQVGRIRCIIQAMDLEVQSLLKKKIFYEKLAIQSRAHLLQVEEVSNIAPSDASPAMSEAHTIVGSPVRMQSLSPMSPPIGSLVSKSVTRALYYFQDLPINIEITSSITSCTLLAGKVDYIFDLEPVQNGRLLVTNIKTERDGSIARRVDVRALSHLKDLSLKDEEDKSTLDICVHDAEHHELRITFIWG